MEDLSSPITQKLYEMADHAGRNKMNQDSEEDQELLVEGSELNGKIQQVSIIKLKDITNGQDVEMVSKELSRNSAAIIMSKVASEEDQKKSNGEAIIIGPITESKPSIKKHRHLESPPYMREIGSDQTVKGKTELNSKRVSSVHEVTGINFKSMEPLKDGEESLKTFVSPDGRMGPKG